MFKLFAMSTLPFDYAVRNIGRSPSRMIMSVTGSALVVALVIVAVAFIQGMESSLKESASKENVILLGAGSEESIERSEIKASVPAQAAASINGLKQKLGVTYVSPEIHMSLGIGFKPDEATTKNALIRGVRAEAFLVHPQVRMVEGRIFETGEDEVIIGRLTAVRLGLTPDFLQVGKTIWIDGQALKIVGMFDAPGTVMNAEIWMPLNNLVVLGKRDALSCVVMTLADAELADVQVFTSLRLDLELMAMLESEYYEKLSDFYAPIRTMVWVTALLIATGGLLGGLNTMYAAFASRVREIGMLQSLGFSRISIITSFIQESTLTAMAGAILGTALCLALLDGLAIPFSMGAFGLHINGLTILLGMSAGLVLGLLGALPPLLRCLRLPITSALKTS